MVPLRPAVLLLLPLLAQTQVPVERELTMPDGDVRRYLLQLPPGYQKSEAGAVVMDFHGAGSNPAQQLLYSNLTPLAARDRVILVHPNSRSRDRPRKSAWHGTLYLPDDPADVEFILELARVLEQDLGASAFFALGMSSGGDISCSLACVPGSPFEGFGAVTYAYYWGTNPNGGGLYPGNELDTPPPSLVTGAPTTENCAHGEGRRMMYFHGTDDFVCPYEGTGPEWYDPPREETARRWARHNRCSNEDPEIEQVSELAQRWVWSGCTAPTEYYKIEDFGHTWPGCAQPRLLPRLFQGRFLLLLRRRQLAQKQRRGCAEGRCQCVQVAWGEPLWDCCERAALGLLRAGRAREQQHGNAQDWRVTRMYIR